MFPRERSFRILSIIPALVTKLVNSVMLDGKKGVAQKVVYGAFEIVEEKTGKNASGRFPAGDGKHHARPWKSRPAVSAAPTYQVPMEVRPERRQTLGLRWLTAYSRKRSEKHHERAPGRRDHGRLPTTPAPL